MSFYYRNQPWWCLTRQCSGLTRTIFKCWGVPVVPEIDLKPGVWHMLTQPEFNFLVHFYIWPKIRFQLHSFLYLSCLLLLRLHPAIPRVKFLVLWSGITSGCTWGILCGVGIEPRPVICKVLTILSGPSTSLFYTWVYNFLTIICWKDSFPYSPKTSKKK